MLRRDFLALGAAAATSMVSGKAFASATEPADLFGRDLALLNGHFITLDERMPIAEAVLVRAGRIAMIGSNAEIRRAARGIPTEDLNGQTVIPGFVDNHCHIEWACMAGDWIPSLNKATSIAEMIGMVRDVAARTPPGKWVVLNASGFPDKVTERRWLTREDLDQAVPDRPVMVLLGIHASVMNSVAFKTSGYWEPGTDKNVHWSDGSPRRGSYVHRDASGIPTGVITEAWDLIGNRFPTDHYISSIKNHFRDWFLSKGLTSITTLPNVAPEQMRALEILSASGDLSARVRFYPTVPHAIPLEDITRVGWQSGFGNSMLTFGGIKIFADNGSDGMGAPRDDLKWTQEGLTAALTACQRNGLQTIIHVVTQAGMDLTMNAMEAARRAYPAELGHRIDHLTPTDIDQIRRAKALGVTLGITAPQAAPGSAPRSFRSYESPHRYRTLLNEGVKTILVLDAAGPGGNYHPMRGIANVISEQGKGGWATPGEALTFDQALRMWTLWAADANGDGGNRGSISLGKFGDFAVLSNNPTGKASPEIAGIVTDMTIVGGNIVYRA